MAILLLHWISELEATLEIVAQKLLHYDGETDVWKGRV